ncbi:MAG: formamidopyrimidine-DNA glycosylase [Cellvibrionaceae bacterium]|jgi:formamidopyrimidine-DNA glycosylase
MPELPEVETTRRALEPHLTGRTVHKLLIRQPSLRWPVPQSLPDHLQNKKLLAIQRRGKYLLFRFDHGYMLVHLGMSGSLRIVKVDELPKKHDHIDWIFSSQKIMRFHDPRRFGSVLWTEEPIESHRLLKNLGPEPLSADFDGDYLFKASRNRQKNIKSFIMDSHIVVGVGNIYANESLFMAGLRPSRPVTRVSRAAYHTLAEAIKNVLQRSIVQGGSTLRDFVSGDGQPGYFTQQLNVYGRQNQVCNICGKILKALRQAQRISVYCPQCQT